MTKKFFEVKRGNVVVKVYERHRTKAGRSYPEFIVDDRSSGGRKFWTRSTLADAKVKAAEVADAIQKGNVPASRWESGLRLELRKALETLEPTGMGILPACQIMAQAVRMLGNPDDLLAACQHWKTHRPEKPVVATSIERAVEAYQASRKLRISGRRYRTEESYFRKVLKEFAGKSIHEITVDDLDQLVGRQKWLSKTRNDFLTSLSPIFEFAARRYWVPKDHNPVKGVARAREAQPAIEIFEPWEMKQMLSRLAAAAPGLVPFLAIWAFAGIRKDEIARMSWPQVNRGLTTGFFELQARETKNGVYRIVPIEENLKAWLTAYREENGSILPSFWLGTTKAGSPRIDEITRYIARNTGVVWKSNAPRHSYASFRFKLTKDVGELTRAMGTSIEKFERNYWNKSQLVTDETAKEWFSILPDERCKIVSIANVPENADYNAHLATNHG